MTAADWLPKNRREIAAIVAGAALALGASQIPGVTFEPAELSQCKLKVVALEAAAEADVKAAAAVAETKEDLEDRIARCWQRYRERELGVRVESRSDDVEGAPYDVEIVTPTPHD